VVVAGKPVLYPPPPLPPHPLSFLLTTLQIKNSSVLTQHNPASHADVVASYSNASPAEVSTAIEAALAAQEAWASLPFADRAAVFLKAADLISGKYRYEIMAATMVGQGKNAWQAEIDAAAELCDFLRYVDGNNSGDRGPWLIDAGSM
jgi:1-pyrroline-5-carboxylate dehydrogenase